MIELQSSVRIAVRALGRLFNQPEGEGMKRVLLALLAVLLSACSQMESGVVVSRIHTPASGYYSTVCVSYGKYGCNVTMPVWTPTPEEWELFLRNAEDEGYRNVTEREYNDYHVGDHYP